MSSLIESPQYNIPEYRPPVVPQADTGESGSQVNLLAVAWQSRWLILLCTLLGGAAAWGVLQRATPLYTSSSQILVERSMPKLLEGDVAIGQSQNFLNTQAELMQSTSVIALAAEQPEVRDLVVLREADNPVALIRKALDVVVGERNDVITISVEMTDPDASAQVANAIVDAYITKYAEDRRTDVVDVMNILRNEKIRRDEDLATARKRLDDFRRDHATLSVQTSEGNVVTQRFGMLSNELNETEIELLQSRARFNRVKQMYDTPSQRPFLLEMATANTDHLRGESMETQIRELEQQLAAELTRWGEGYPRVKLLKSSLEDLRHRRDEQHTNIVAAYVDSLQQDADLLQHKRDELKAAYDEQFSLATEISSQLVTLESLREELVRAETASDLIDERIKQLNLSEEAVGAKSVSTMEVAGPGWQSYPERPKFLGMGVAFGGLLGFGLAWLRDLLDHRLRSIDEIAETMQVPIVGMVPLLTAARTRAEAGQFVASRPRSTAAESVRTLRTGLNFGMGGAETKIIVVTSPSPGDGKSIVASNLAIAMSQMGLRVLLIDADMRKPTQGEIFGVADGDGLSHVLSTRQQAKDSVQASGIESLDILPCGRLPGNPAELLNNGYLGDMLEDLMTTYDRIIIDSPPVMAVADARIIAAIGHCTLLVLRAERATRRLSVAARDELLRVRARHLGVVVNGVPPRKQAYGYGTSYGSYGYSSQLEYGYNDDEVAVRNADHDRNAADRPLIRSTK